MFPFYILICLYSVYCMVTIWADIFGIYIFGWEGVAWINVEDKGMAQINVASSQVSGTGQLDHCGRPLIQSRNVLACISWEKIFTSDYYPQSYWLCLIN